MLDLSYKPCHDINMLQKVETWRIKELEYILNQLSGLLRRGNNNDWANVFAHFHYESQQILTKKEFNLNTLKRLVLNIKNCYESASSFKELTFGYENPDENSGLNREFHLLKSQLFDILMEIEDKTVDYIS